MAILGVGQLSSFEGLGKNSQHGPRDFDRLGQSALLRPTLEEAQMLAAHMARVPLFPMRSMVGFYDAGIASLYSSRTLRNVSASPRSNAVFASFISRSRKAKSASFAARSG